jgi:hypothetical protein
MAAHAANLGLPAWRLLCTEDADERLLLTAVTLRARELADEQTQALARAIRSEIVDAWNRGQRGR